MVVYGHRQIGNWFTIGCGDHSCNRNACGSWLGNEVILLTACQPNHQKQQQQ